MAALSKTERDELVRVSHSDADERVRRRAYETLGIDIVEMTRLLEREIRNTATHASDPSLPVWGPSIAITLGWFSVPVLRRLCNDSDPLVRLAASAALGRVTQICIPPTQPEDADPQHMAYIASVLNNQGVHLAAVGNHNAALDRFQKARSAKPDVATVWVNEAVEYHALDRVEEAIRCLDQALILDPYHTRAKLCRDQYRANPQGVEVAPD